MPDSEKQPDEADILQEAQHLGDVWAKTHAQWAETDQWVQGTYRVWENATDRAQRSSLRSNTGRTIIDRTSDNLLPFNPQWHRDPLRDGNTDRDEADPVENFVDALWLDTSLRKNTALPAKQWGRDFLKYSYAVAEVGFNPQDAPKKPLAQDPYGLVRLREFEESEWNFHPFSVSAPHPSTILINPNERTPTVAIKRIRWYMRDLVAYLAGVKEADAENLVSIEVPDVGLQPFHEILVTEYFSTWWHGLVAEGLGLLLLEANLSAIVPFRHAFGSFGDRPGGEDGGDPKYRAQGFLYPVRDLLRLLDQIINAKAELEMKAAYAVLVVPEDLLERIAGLLQQGANMIPGVLHDIGFMPVQQLPQYLADFQARVEQAIVTATVSTVSFGERPVGVDTVGQHAMMLQVSFKRVVETMEQLSFLTSEVGSMWLQFMPLLEGKVMVRGHSLTAEDLKHNYHIVASFPMTDEAVRQNRTQLGAGLVQQGLKSKRRHWEEDQGITDVKRERDEILEDSVRADPILHSAFAEKKRQELKLQEIYEEQLQRLAAERMGAFNQVQAERGQPGVNIPPREEDMLVGNAERNSFVRPPASGPGAGQPSNGGGS